MLAVAAVAGMAAAAVPDALGAVPVAADPHTPMQISQAIPPTPKVYKPETEKLLSHIPFPSVKVSVWLLM